MESIWFVASNDLRSMLRARETLVWAFLMPLGFFYFIGTATQGAGGGGDSAAATPLTLVATKGDESLLCTRLVHHLTEGGFAVSIAAEAPDARRTLFVPEGADECVLRGEPVALRLETDADDLRRDQDQIRVQRAVYTVLADLVSATREGAVRDEAQYASLDAMPRTVTLDVQAAGERRRVPSGFEQAIPGTMVMFTLVVVLTSGAVLLTLERRQGLLRRLASAPLSRASIFTGKWVGKMALGIVQVAFGMVAGTFLFDMDWGDRFPAVLLLMACWASFCASLGLLLGSVVRSEGQAVAVGVLSTNLLAALGGCWWPLEVAPKWLQSVGAVLPTGWTMDAMHELVSYGSPVTAIIPQATALLVGALVCGGLAVRWFRYD